MVVLSNDPLVDSAAELTPEGGWHLRAEFGVQIEEHRRLISPEGVVASQSDFEVSSLVVLAQLIDGGLHVFAKYVKASG